MLVANPYEIYLSSIRLTKCRWIDQYIFLNKSISIQNYHLNVESLLKDLPLLLFKDLITCYGVIIAVFLTVDQINIYKQKIYNV